MAGYTVRYSTVHMFFLIGLAIEREALSLSIHSFSFPPCMQMNAIKK